MSSKQASEKGVEHQVRAGTGTQYGHAISRPSYLDTLDKPYAVFRFKYRSRGILKSMFGNLVPDHGRLTTHTPSSKMVREKEKLENATKEELIDKMVRMKMDAEKKGKRRESGHARRESRRRAVSENTESVARGLTENWVKQHSRNPSEKAKSDGKEKNKEGGWDQIAW